MADNDPQPKSIRRTLRRRAERAVDRNLAIDHFRQQIQRRGQHDVADSDSSGNVDEDEPDTSDHSEGEVSGNSSDDEMRENVGEEREDAMRNEHEEMDVDEVDSDGNVNEAIASESEDDLDGHESEDEAAPPAEDIANMTAEEKEAYLKQSLREWASSGGVLSMRKIDELLGKLSFVFQTLPKSYKYLLNTAETVDVNVADDHKMWYKGIRTNLDCMILDNYFDSHGCIKLDVNMDGLPLTRESKCQKFWPILGKLVGTDDDPFEIAIYCGRKDPSDVDLFLGDFVTEVDDLKRNGYEINGVAVPVIFNNFILDAPARSLVKCCIGHGGYGACEKCCVVGEYTEGRMNYFNVSADCLKRTDQSYIDQADRLHHTGRSPLQLVNIGMVSQFRLDTLHLVYKGVFLRLLEATFTWQGEWNPDADTLRDISALLLSLVDSCPRDFNRKPRSIEDYYKYKATELRRLLLYNGILVFKDKFTDEMYSLFLLLHCAIYILSSPYLLPTWADRAEEFIRNFVQYSCEIFGQHFVVYNIHSLLHLTDECREHGTLESFSAFIYENRLKTIKQTLRSGYQPLEQIAKRDSERREKRLVKLKTLENSVQLFQPLPQLPNHFKRISVNGVVFTLGVKDSCFMTYNGGVVVLQNIIQREGNNIIFSGKRFNHHDNFYTYPMNSAELGILKVWELSDVVENFPLQEFVLLRFRIADQDDPEDVTEELEIARREWLSVDDDGVFECAWPSNITDPNKLKAMVTKNVIPDESWSKHPCDIVSAYSNYLDAHIGLKKRLADSDYVTEKDTGRGCRRRRTRKLSSDSEGEDLPVKKSKTLPKPPKISSDPRSQHVFKDTGGKKAPITFNLKEETAAKLQKQNNLNTLNVLRRNHKGTKAATFEEFKKILVEKKKGEEKKKNDMEAMMKKVGLENVVATSPSWKAPGVSEAKQSLDDNLNTTLLVDDEWNTSNEFQELEDTPMEKTIIDVRKALFTSEKKSPQIDKNPSTSETNLPRKDRNTSTSAKNKSTENKKVPSTSTQNESSWRNETPSTSAQNESSWRNETPSTSAQNELPWRHQTPSTFAHKRSSQEELSPSASTASPYTSDFERKFLVLLHELNQKADIIITNQTKLNLNLIPNEKVLSKPEGMPTVPLKDSAAVRKMEKVLEDHSDFVSNLSTYLSNHVSKDATKEGISAKKVMAALLSNSVAKNYSLRGQKGKERFDETKMWAAVKGAIILKIATDFVETEEAVKKWLKDAGWRKQSDGSDSRHKN